MPVVLQEQDRVKLDGIVQKMMANKESDENIQFVVSDFKTKYGVKKKEGGASPSIGQSELPEASPDAIRAFLSGGTVEQRQEEKKRQQVVRPTVTEKKVVKDERPFEPKITDASVQAAHGKINEIMYGDGWKDPVKEIERQAKEVKDIGEMNVLNIAAQIARNSLAPDGVEAKRILQESHLGKEPSDNQTTKMLADKAMRYDADIQTLRNVPVQDLTGASPEFLDYSYTPQLRDAAVRYRANHDEQFKMQLEKLGVDLDGNFLFEKIPSSVAGQTMAEFLNSESVQTYLQKEAPQLVPAFERAQQTILTDNKDFGINQVANKVSRAIQKTGFNNIDPIFNFNSKLSQDFANQVAENVLTPEELEIYNANIRDRQGDYLDKPSFFEGAAGGIKHVVGGIESTAKIPFESRGERVYEQMDKEASNVSANPTGLLKGLRGMGSAAGFVASLIAGGEVFAGAKLISNSSTAQKVLIGTSMYGDLQREADSKYKSPVKAFTSAMFQTMGYMYLSNIFPSAKIKEAFKQVKPEMGRIASELSSGKLTREGARIEAQNVLQNIFEWGKKAGVQNLKASGEMTGLVMANRWMDRIMGLDGDTFEKYHPQGEDWETFKTMFLDNSLVSGTMGVAEMRRNTRAAKDIAYELAKEPKKFERLIDQMQFANPELKIEDMKGALRILADAKKELDVNKIAEKDQKIYLLHAKNEADLKSKAAQTSEPTLKKRYEQEAKRSAEIKEGILKGLTEEQIMERQAIKDVKELYSEDFLSKGDKELLETSEGEESKPKFDEKKVKKFLEYVSQQANNVDAEGNFVTTSDARKSVKWPQQLIDIANEMFPQHRKTAEDFDVKNTITEAVELDPTLPKDYELPTQETKEVEVNIPEINKQTEKITIETPKGFSNRVHEGGLSLGKPTGNSHVTEKGYTYRSVGEGEIKSITESGGVFPREGKQKGGNANVKYWSKGDGKFFYKENQNVIRVKNENIAIDKVVSAENLEIWDKSQKKFVPFNEFGESKKPTIRVTAEQMQAGQPTKEQVSAPPTGEGGGGQPPSEPPRTTSGQGGGDGMRDLDRLANNVPDSGKMAEYMSKDTIEKYTGETPTNDQSRGVQELSIALEHGEKIIEKAQTVFGNDWVDKTLDYIESSTAGISNKALMYVSLENALGREKLLVPERAAELTRQQALVYEQSQKFAREYSLALNYQKLRKIAQVGYDIERVTNGFFSPDELAGRNTVERAVEADADRINKEAESKETVDPDIEKKISEGVAKEVEKIYQQLPKEKKSAADRAIEAIEKAQSKLRSKTYDAGIGLPVAVLDAGLTTVKLAIKAGVKVADAIEMGVSKIKEKWGKEWKEDEFRRDMAEVFKNVKSANQIVKDALIERGFGRELTVKGENKTILDWKKLAGRAGTVSKISENVAEVLKDKGYSEKEIEKMKNDLVDEYVDLRASVIEKSQNELARRNKENVTSDQKSAARKLAELYTYGAFEKDTNEFDVALNKAVGVKVSNEGYQEAKEIAKAMEILYSSSFKGAKLNDVSGKAAIERLEDRLRVLLFREARKQGNGNLFAATLVRNYFEIQQTMILNNLKQAVENPFSGLQQNVLSSMTEGMGTKEMRKQRRKLMADIYTDMVVKGGVGYGKVESTFVNRQHLDDYINKLSDNQVYHFFASIATGKTTLNAMDSMWKAGITEKKFANNLIKVLTHESNKNRLSKEEAQKFVSEQLTGQTFKDAQKTAKEVIDKINEGREKGKELIPTNQTQIDRFANDIVKAALEMGGKIDAKQIEAAYNAAYRSAGLGLGHTANNFMSAMIHKQSAIIEGNLNQAIRNKQWNRAALLTYYSVFFRNILNPFVGGGTNWLVLKFEKTGLGLFTGLAYKYGTKTQLDLTTEKGLREMEQNLYNQSRIKDNYMRGIIGGIITWGSWAAFLGLASSDDYRKWRAKNKWAARYLDILTPEPMLAQMSVKNGEVKKYVSQSLNKNDAFDAGTKVIKAADNFSKGKNNEGWGALGEAAGSKFNIPLPWRLVKDAQVIYQGAIGQDPYHGNYKPSTGFLNGALLGGAIEWLGARPEGAGETPKGKNSSRNQRNSQSRSKSRR